MAAVTRAAVVAEARRWLRTPFLHQADRRGVGCDCAGLLRGVCIELGVFPRDYRALPSAAPFLGYARVPDGRSMEQACIAFMTPIAARSDMQPGDAMLIRWGRNPQHMGIVGDYVHGGLSLIHAFSTSDGKGSVIEHRLDESMLRRFVAAYRLPGVLA